ncbi:uncharacterized protein LOC127802581 [Diospyros lotus]|uniref:uncharacterized protein LOC127802581 n=1 Tax=Diospyros lotus TaxID=55363 RepID=UPI0022550A83|nr:uncharacterized protein LOC127802581 [Diospyros lotus]
MEEQKPLLRTLALSKQHSWSPDLLRDEAWSRRKGNQKLRLRRRSRSVTDDDLEELKACFELGFGFETNSVGIDPKLSDTFPALGLYHAVNKQYAQSLSRSSSSASMAVSDSDTASLSSASPSTIFDDSGDNPEMVKTRLRQWAQVVACAVRQAASN